MQTTVSTKGQVVLPRPVRTKLGIQAGDALDIRVENDQVILTPRKKRAPKARIIKDARTGKSVLYAGPEAPTLTSEQVAELLVDFP
jgi:AbrB family looped-hinge helix DNA binding protein